MRRTLESLLRGLIIGLVALAALGPAAPASAADWVQNFVPTDLWSGPDASAVSFGPAPQWEFFQVLGPQVGGRLYVLVVRTGSYAYVDASTIGPSGPPPVGWPGGSPGAATAPPRTAPGPISQSTVQGPPAGQAALGPVPGFTIAADRGLWPALQTLQSLQHGWTLQALSASGTRLEWALMPPDASGAYQPSRSLITFNVRWYRSDPRALAAIIEHEAKHVADFISGMDIESPTGCIATEVNAFREEAKTWGELVGPAGKVDPVDELEYSLNVKLALLRQSPDAIEKLILQSSGYRAQCHLRSTIDALAS